MLPRSLITQSGAVFIAACAFLTALAPTAPFARELGVCEAGAVRDVVAGSIILPRFEPGVYVHVPPLYWWLAALCVRLFGMVELALRMPSMIAAALTCALVYWWLATVSAKRAGLIGAVALLTCHFFADAARQPRMDAMLALFVTASVVALERALAVTAVSAGRSSAMRWLAVASALMALGILTKGPLGIVLPAVALAFYLMLRRRAVELFRPAMIATFVAALAVGVAWYVAAYRVGGQPFFDWQVKVGLFRRFVPTEVGGAGFCKHPFYYFIPQILIGFMPWTVYLPALAAIFVDGVRRSPKDTRLPETLVFAGCWFVAMVGFFSSSTGKCLIYILPAFPPLAAMVGIAAEEVAGSRLERGWPSRLFSVGSSAIAVGAVASLLALAIAATNGVPHSALARMHSSDRAYLAIFQALAAARSTSLGLWAALWIGGSAMIAAGIARSRPGMHLGGAAIVAAAGVLFWFGTIDLMRANQISLKTFAAEIDRVLPPGARVDYVGAVDCEVAFMYASHPVGHIDALPGRDTEGRYLILWSDRFQSLDPQSRARFDVLAQSASVDRHGPRLLVRGRAAGSPR